MTGVVDADGVAGGVPELDGVAGGVPELERVCEGEPVPDALGVPVALASGTGPTGLPAAISAATCLTSAACAR